MKYFFNSKTLSEGLSQLLRPGRKIVAGVVLIAAGLPLSMPVLIGDPGGSTVWWPILIFVGIAWAATGVGGFFKSKLGRS